MTDSAEPLVWLERALDLSASLRDQQERALDDVAQRRDLADHPANPQRSFKDEKLARKVRHVAELLRIALDEPEP